MLSLAAGFLYHVGGIDQGTVCGHAVLLSPSQLIGMCLITVSPQIMAYMYATA